MQPLPRLLQKQRRLLVKHQKQHIMILCAWLLWNAVAFPPPNCPAALPAETATLMGAFCAEADSTTLVKPGPSHQPMPLGVLMKGDDLQIVDSVVSFDPIFVMDALGGVERAPQVLFHYMTMFFNSLAAWQPEFNISTRTNPSSSRESGGLFPGAMFCTAGHGAILGRSDCNLRPWNKKPIAAFFALLSHLVSPLRQSPFAFARTCCSAASLTGRHQEVTAAFRALQCCFHGAILPCSRMGATAKTYTLDDDTNPTSITEAT